MKKSISVSHLVLTVTLCCTLTINTASGYSLGSDPRPRDTGSRIRLIYNETTNSGIVQVKIGRRWGYVCDNQWDIQDANVACKQLGFPDGATAAVKGWWGMFPTYDAYDFEILLDKVRCTGSESNLFECTYDTSHDCLRLEAASVVCKVQKGIGKSTTPASATTPPTTITPTAVKSSTPKPVDLSNICPGVELVLVDGNKTTEGRVQVLLFGKPGTVCGRHWDQKDSALLCRTLGYKHGGVTKSFGPGRGPVLMGDFNCTDSDSTIFHCDFNLVPDGCDHSQDVGVECFTSAQTTATTTTTTTTATTTTTTAPTTTTTTTTTTTPKTTATTTTTAKPAVSSFGKQHADWKLMLVGGRDETEGNIQIVINGTNYGICDDDWGDEEANLFCRQMGFFGGGIPMDKSYYGIQMVKIIMDDFQCSGDEAYPENCKMLFGVTKHDCSLDELAGLMCFKSIPVGPVNPKPASYDGTCGYVPYMYKDGERAQDDGFVDKKYHIAGGEIADNGRHPYMVRLILSTLTKNHYCGGSIIDEYWIISAGHCFGEVLSAIDETYSIKVYAGDHRKSVTEDSEQIFAVKGIFFPEDFVYGRHHVKNDVALLQVWPNRGRGFRFNDHVQPICLPHGGMPAIEGTQCWTAGWGKTRDIRGYTPDTMREGRVLLMSPHKCEYLYSKVRLRAPFMPENEICAGQISGDSEICEGDSGGPLACNIDGKYTLMGVASWGVEGCGTPKFPGIFAFIPYHAEWIQKTMKKYGENNLSSEDSSEKTIEEDGEDGSHSEGSSFWEKLSEARRDKNAAMNEKLKKIDRWLDHYLKKMGIR